jgi:hypothetical protein
MGIAIAAAMMKAIHTRKVDTPACHRRDSETSILHRACITRLGEGRNCGATHPALAASSQRAMRIAAVSSPMEISATGGARPRKVVRSRNTLHFRRGGKAFASLCTDIVYCAGAPSLLITELSIC